MNITHPQLQSRRRKRRRRNQVFWELGSILLFPDSHLMQVIVEEGKVFLANAAKYSNICLPMI